MKRKLYMILTLMLAAAVCRGAPVYPGFAKWGQGTLDGHLLGGLAYRTPYRDRFMEEEDYDPDYCDVWFTMQLLTSSSQAILGDWVIHTLGFRALMLETSRDTLIDHGLFFDSPGPFFLSDLEYQKPLVIPLTDPDFSNTVILALAIGEGRSAPGSLVFWYGWIEFGYDGEYVFIHDSAVASYQTGIYAGTYSVVPEPSTALLALSGVALLLRRRRQKEKR